MGRMERYDNSNVNRVRSRTEKNKDLYNDLGRLEKYTTLTDVSKIEAVELNAAKKNYRTREGYHSLKDYDINVEKPTVKKELDEFNFLYNDEHKTYDINKVLEEAKELREKDSKEKKRKLQNEKYNILESSKEDLEKFKEETKLRHKPIENEKELEDLIHTITSKELRDEIDKREAEKLIDLENKSIPENNDYSKIVNLASEARQKLSEIRPTSIGQAMRISGVNPSDIAILMIYLKKEYKNEKR